ncbi:hypothetical protein [Hirschia litorea]|uniref:Uncharacterized protein n=1 Tax=Hirschia litorea TaxID=1199156 RepID=A0ABW2IL01_9PROT
MLGLFILIRDSILAILMTWAGMDGTSEKSEENDTSFSSSSIQRTL